MPATAPDGLRERRKADTRRALVAAALRLFAERGYTQVTVEDVCAAASVSQRTFFRYFRGKEQVLAAPATGMLDALHASLSGQPRRASVWPALRAAVLAAVELVEDHRAEFLAGAQVVRATPEALASSAGAFVDREQVLQEQVADRLGVPPGLQTSLLVGITLTALRCALNAWTASGGAAPLRGHALAALDAVAPGARSVERAARG